MSVLEWVAGAASLVAIALSVLSAHHSRRAIRSARKAQENADRLWRARAGGYL